jgi:hypothetical protein
MPVVPRLPFDRRLVLYQWMLSLFGVQSLEQLTDRCGLKQPELEGFDEEGVSHFHRAITAHFIDLPELPKDLLLVYDTNIVRHWRRISEGRNRLSSSLFPKYFQYLALLFTEIYLDRYFNGLERLLSELNVRVKAFNSHAPARDQVPAYEASHLNKIALWQATGSGKTLLMHVNILQYRHYLTQAGRAHELNRILLLTPNEGLSQQHLGEFEASGIDAELFSKVARGEVVGKAIEIIDIHKLEEESGDKTVAVETFEGNNLVLVDEGHRGSSGEDWKAKRDQLCADGFSFEYSATFGQAMKAANKPDLANEYAKCILFDYSYKFFYRDGYGKDYNILNFEQDNLEDARRQYLTACMLSFYQQLKINADQSSALRPFLIERPLCVFVGGSVNAVRTENRRKVSDVLDVLLFLADFVSNESRSVEDIHLLLTQHDSLLTSSNERVFANAFGYLGGASTPAHAEQVFRDMLRIVFNAEMPAALHVELLKGADGEIALRLGANEPFGVINVGDASGLYALCETHDDLKTETREFAEGYFRSLNQPNSQINILIGSKKFTEGWNSWRVSTMGLMNIGRKEGSEIIQLFGRGVRLKGFNFSLKRSTHAPRGSLSLPPGINQLETLNVFGVRADYMRQFKSYLDDEGISTDTRRELFTIDTQFMPLPSVSLKTIRIKNGLNFKRDAPKPVLGMPYEGLTADKVKLDWYPRVAMTASRHASNDRAYKMSGVFTPAHVAFMDLDAIYFALQAFKAERAWHNLCLPREVIGALLARSDWYELMIPPELIRFDDADMHRIRVWEQIATSLLNKYTERFYYYAKAAWEEPRLEYQELRPDDPNYIDQYKLMVAQSETDVINAIKNLKEDIDAGKLKDIDINKFFAIAFNQHLLYQPLLYVKSDLVDVRPVPLNDGEKNFVLALRDFYNRDTAFFADKELYLLRNRSRVGLGFFEAGNFYPDFIIWLVSASKQYVTFVDPKGLRNLGQLDHPKIRFHEKIKEIERRLGDPDVVLNSYIVSSTPLDVPNWWGSGIAPEIWNQNHVLDARSPRYIHHLVGIK